MQHVALDEILSERTLCVVAEHEEYFVLVNPSVAFRVRERRDGTGTDATAVNATNWGECFSFFFLFSSGLSKHPVTAAQQAECSVLPCLLLISDYGLDFRKVAYI